MVCTVTYGLKSIKHTGYVLWNNLTEADRNKPSKKSVAYNIKKNFLQTY